MNYTVVELNNNNIWIIKQQKQKTLRFMNKNDQQNLCDCNIYGDCRKGWVSREYHKFFYR